MTVNEIHERLKASFGEAVAPLSEPKIDPFARVAKERLVEVARFLKSTPGLELDHCNDITGLDWPKRKVIEVVYHLFSYRHRHGIVLKVELDRDEPAVASVEGVWKAANWLERECYDMFGVVFEGHPDLRRVLLPDDWKGHPLRKDYAEAGGYHGISNVRENPLVELRRLDEKERAEQPAPPPPSAPPPGAAAPPAPTGPAPTRS
ncbi:MAG TPA: NADH-quinone oxidoreductase subunit C [Anaeromyxobacteraceae bacterium]|nr:NADH-quinone oxidoreductase subunit C [Anaeromyxobacteraceae bacterium]